jgi:hypothetical protein
MKTINSVILALSLGSAASFAGDCEQPNAPQLPDGASSSMEQMLAGQKSVKAFQTANLEYMACLEPQLTAAQAAAKEGAEEARATHKQIEEAYNAAVSMEEEVAGQFNTEIREYKAANPG